MNDYSRAEQRRCFCFKTFEPLWSNGNTFYTVCWPCSPKNVTRSNPSKGNVPTIFFTVLSIQQRELRSFARARIIFGCYRIRRNWPQHWSFRWQVVFYFSFKVSYLKENQIVFEGHSLSKYRISFSIYFWRRIFKRGSRQCWVEIFLFADVKINHSLLRLPENCFISRVTFIPVLKAFLIADSSVKISCFQFQRNI